MITPELLWTVHRAVLGGKSSVTGKPIPERLDQCPPGAQGAHYAMAVAASILGDLEPPTIPPGVSNEEARRIWDVVQTQVQAYRRTPVPPPPPTLRDPL